MRLKKYFLCAVWAFTSVTMCISCSSDDGGEEAVTPSLSITPTDVNARAGGEEINVTVKATSAWTTVIDSDVDWVKVKSSDVQTGKLVITIIANTTIEKRSTNVVIKLNDADLAKPIKIQQAAANATLTVSPMEVTDIPAEGKEYTFTVQSSAGVDWGYEVPVEHQNWIKEKLKTESSVVFAFEANTGSQRGCYILFKDKNQKASSVNVKVIQLKPEDFDPNDPIKRGFTLQGSMKGSADLVGKRYSDVHTYMRKFGWDYSEHPNSSTKDHDDVEHIETVFDATINQYVFRFISHASSALDGDRGSMNDRMRNEMKSQTSASWYKLNGNWGESQILQWKFKIPKGYRPCTSFCHIHQLKAQEGDNGAPVVTISLRGNNDGTNRRVQVIHSLGDDKSAGTKSLGTFVDNVKIEEFEDEWVQVHEEVTYDHHGKFRLLITRIRDGKVLIDNTQNDIDTWRKGAISIRNKFGIYRSYGGLDANGKPKSGIKDETLELADFVIYEKDTNPNPVPHD